MAHTGTPIQFTTLQTPAPTICSGCKENMDHQNPSSSNDESSSSPPLSYRPIRAPALNIPNRTSAQTAIMLTPVPQPQFVPTIYSSSDAEDGSAPHAHVFIAPSKRITSPNDIDKFLSPPSSGDNFLGFIASLSHSVLRKKISDPLPVPLSPTLESLLDLLQKLSLWVDEIPPVLHQARYGNPAFRDWFQRLAVEGKLLAIQILPEDLRLSAIVEVFPYLLDSFGNCTRIDYGTGHETNFAAFLYCLVRIGLIKEEDYQGLVLKVFVCYLDLMRKLQNVYSLEPAGSHGVWGLDDYHFLPFVFGSAQLVDHKYMKPKSIHNPDILDNFSKEYMYLECVLFVKSVKKGLFAEHSPLLDDISGVQKWSKVHGGMLKMYKAEVLQKVPIMQHFLFGSLIKCRLAVCNLNMSESASTNKMVEIDESIGWEEMIPDALGLIFKKLSLQEILTVIPGVCKSWKKAVSGPYCWQEINIDDWSQRNPQYIDQMVHMLIIRSSGSLHKLCVSNLPNDHIFSFIADHAASLHTLELQRSDISDNIVEQVAGKFSNLTFLDISYCGKIGSSGVEAFGKNCRSLFVLKRVMHPLDVADKVCQDDEAHAIARSMPKLKTLELAYLRLTTNGVLDILTSCKNLEYLDIRGCWDVKLDEKFLKEELLGLKLVGPLIYWDNCSDYSESSGYLSWEFMDDGGVGYEVMSDDEGLWDDDEDDEQGLEQLEVRFYDGGFGNNGFVWPPSP